VPFLTLAAPLVALCAAACGGRTGAIDDDRPDAGLPRPAPETCNLLDDDLDGRVDEDFRDPEAGGLYLSDRHCGACGRPCSEPTEPARAVACRPVDGVPTCAATDCAPGFAPSRTGRCVLFPGRFCLPCADDGDCGDLAAASCAEVGGASRCVVACAGGCPEGTVCRPDDQVCVPEGGSCECQPGDRFDLACLIEDPAGGPCVGSARCDDGVQSPCVGFAERCNRTDDDCDALVDEGFVDDRGVYRRDPEHCGACGVSCLGDDGLPEGDLVCGGDPFVPSCVLDCPDTRDGIQPGDRVDADRDVANGCECVVRALVDTPGPPGASGAALDVDCDGADGEVTVSFYVAPDGDDGGPGSPTRPLRTLSEAVTRAAASLDGDRPRPTIFVAAGVYAETLQVADGVRVHGGYRRDFLELEVAGFRTEVRPTDGERFGAALVTAPGAGTARTVVSGLFVLGRDAEELGQPTVAAILDDPGPELALFDVFLRAGLPGEGSVGARGLPGAGPSSTARAGGPPRAAREGADRLCDEGAPSRVAGGRGGGNRCPGEVDVSGGAGGTAICPEALGFPPRTQPEGDDGAAPAGGADPGRGGQGGMDTRGPITGFSCPGTICCGLADFTVPTNFEGPRPGGRGEDGNPGRAGAGCTDTLGRFLGSGRWQPGRAGDGAAGRPGAGGGGGGAGGGAEIAFDADFCAFADGLGGGGGGGGAGGCGGEPGGAGGSGAVSVGILILRPDDDDDDDGGGASRTLPRNLVGVQVRPAAGGRGGDGGAGGEGGRGGAGAAGGSVPRSERDTPTLAGTAAGGNGGDGGNGGNGGGGGGGCGGSSVAVWVVDDALSVGDQGRIDDWFEAGDFVPGSGGAGGRGGGSAGDGADGEAIPLVVRR